MGKHKVHRHVEVFVTYTSNRIHKWSLQINNNSFTRAKYDQLQRLYEEIYYLPINETIDCEDMGLYLHGYRDSKANGVPTNQSFTTDVVKLIRKTEDDILLFVVTDRLNAEGNSESIFYSILSDGSSCKIGTLHNNLRKAAADISSGKKIAASM